MSITFKIKVTPHSYKDEVKSYKDDILNVRLRAVAEKGQANEALIRFLADFFDIPVSCVHLSKGQTARIKLVRLEGITREDALKKLTTSPEIDQNPHSQL